MDFTTGQILEGKVKTITKFGAFVSLPEGRSGLVHISEIAYSYVSEVRDFLTEGQEVKVQVLAIDDAGRINLSIKRAQPRPQQHGRPQQQARPQARPAQKPAMRREPDPSMGEVLPPSNDRSFEDKLKAFMSESDSKMAGVRQYEHRTRNRRR